MFSAILLVRTPEALLTGLAESTTSVTIQMGPAGAMQFAKRNFIFKRHAAEGTQMTKTQAAAAPKAAAKPAKAEIVTLRHLATTVAENHGLSQKQANEVLHETVELIGKHLKKGARIRIAGLGTLEVRKRAARLGRNPATGETIKIKASKKVAFRAAKDLNEAI